MNASGIIEKFVKLRLSLVRSQFWRQALSPKGSKSPAVLPNQKKLSPDHQSIFSEEKAEFLGVLFQKLNSQRSNLQNSAAELENIFLKVGAGLEQLSEGSGNLVTRCEKLHDLQGRGGDGHHVIEPVIQLVRAPLAFLTECEGQLRDAAERLRRAEDQASAVLRASAQVQQTLAPLAFIQILFQVEAARLPTELQQLFTSLSAEIAHFRNRLQDSFAVRLEGMIQARKTMNQGISKLEDAINEHKGSNAANRRRAEKMLEALGHELDRHQSRGTGLADASREISQRVNQIVMDLQSQDSINQRLGHVGEALEKLRLQQESAASGPKDFTVGEFALYAQQAAKIQCAQLQGILAEAEKAERSIQSGLGFISNSIVTMEEACAVGGQEVDSANVGNHAAQLTAVIKDLRTPLSATQNQTAVICNLTQSLGNQASDITKVMRELTGSIWLSGINAQVQATKVEQFTGLEVLSARTSSIANETREVVTNVGSEVDVLAENLREIVVQLETLRDQAATHQNALSDQSAKELEPLERLCSETQNKMKGVVTAAAAVRSQVALLSGLTNFAKNLSATIIPVVETLEELAEQSEPLARESHCTVLPETLAKALGGNYTMAGEVAAHHHALTTTDRRPVSVTASAGDVDLFEDFSAPATTAPRQNMESGDEQIFPESADLTGKKCPSEQPTAKVSLGDNVELF